MSEAFHHGGWGMYPTLVIGVLLVGAAVGYAWRPERRRLLLIVWLQALTLLVGTLGFVSGMIRAARIAGESPSPNATILVGLSESLHNVGLALGLVVAAGIAGAVGLARSRRAGRAGAELVDPLG